MSEQTISLMKRGERISLAKRAPGVKQVVVGAGWVRRMTDGKPFDLDLSAISLDASGKLAKDPATGRYVDIRDFVFYGNPSNTNESIKSTGDDLEGTDVPGKIAEAIAVDLDKVPARVARIVFCVTIHQSKLRRQNFGMVTNAFANLVNYANSQELCRFDLEEDNSTNEAVILVELYRREDDWSFKAVGEGWADGLHGIARSFDVPALDDADAGA